MHWIKICVIARHCQHQGTYDTARAPEFLRGKHKYPVSPSSVNGKKTSCPIPILHPVAESVEPGKSSWQLHHPSLAAQSLVNYTLAKYSGFLHWRQTSPSFASSTGMKVQGKFIKIRSRLIAPEIQIYSNACNAADLCTCSPFLIWIHFLKRRRLFLLWSNKTFIYSL